MRVLFALPGLHRYNRGAEIAFISVARELARLGDAVTLIGSGRAHDGELYRFVGVGSVARENFESFPSIPLLRHEYAYEELSFVPGLLSRYRPADYDATVTCSYPFTNWILRRPVFRGRRPVHIFVTQNGDWPAHSQDAEARFFGCDGLVCTNPDFVERNKERWRCALIPNGVDCERFRPGVARRQDFGLPENRPVVLMVSALNAEKRVATGVAAVSRIADAYLVVAGDGPLRDDIDALASKLLPGRFSRITVKPAQMPSLYQSADVFLHLSKYESFGNVYLEALASGLPIVAHDSARTRWILGDNEFLTDTDDETAIAQQIEQARGASRRSSQESAKRAFEFAWPKIGQMYRKFIEDTVLLRAGYGR